MFALATAPAVAPTVGHPFLVAVVALAVALAAVHVFARRIHVADIVPSRPWLSFAGGVSVAYVFVHLLPEVAERGEAVPGDIFPVALERHVYLVALLGFVAFYGVDRLATRGAPRETAPRGEADATLSGQRGIVFWIHVLAFAAYNAIVGYLLFHRLDAGLVPLAFFGVAMGLHFFVNDYGLREHHAASYHRVGRWVLAAAVIAGAAVGFLTRIDEAALSVLFAFLAGGIVLNVIKEELPGEGEGRFVPFAVGVGGYTVLLLLAAV